MDTKFIAKLFTILFMPLTCKSYLEKDQNSIYGQYFESLSMANRTAGMGSNISDSKLISEFQKAACRCLDSWQLLNNREEVCLLVNRLLGKKLLQDNVSESDFLQTILREVTQAIFSHDEGRLVIKYWGEKDEDCNLGICEDLDRVQCWHFLKRHISCDLLIACFCQCRGSMEFLYHGDPLKKLRAGDRRLNKILAQGVAETHMHRNAAIDFQIVWQEYMNQGKLNISAEKAFLDEKYNEDAPYLSAMAYIRLLMALFLACRHEYAYADEENCFREFILLALEGLGGECQLTALCEKVFKGERILKKDVKIGLSSQTGGGLMSFTRLKTHLRARFNTLFVAERYEKDCIKNLTKFSDATFAEYIFLYEALDYIAESKAQDGVFASLFWQYCRVKNRAYQTVTQNNQVAGLKNFQDYYHKATKVHDFLSMKESWQKTIQSLLECENLKKIEFRVSWKDLGENLRTFAQMYKTLQNNPCYSEDLPQMALTLHFIKRPDEKRDHYVGDSRKWHFASYRKELLRQLKFFMDFRYKKPDIGKHVCSIDAASDEFNTEPWVFAPVFRKARDGKCVKAHAQDGQILPPLGLTYHVGEDFHHILTGLRHIDEVIEHFSYKSGDRLGHAIALGISPKEWIMRTGQTVMPRIEFVETVLWLWNRKNEIPSAGKLWQKWEQLFWKQLEAIFGMECTRYNVNTFCNAYLMKFRDYEEDGFIFEAESNQVYYCYHCESYIEKMQESLYLRLSESDADDIQGMQDWLRKKVAAKGVIVETNPSSNAVISGMGAIFQHHSIEFYNALGASESSRFITINTDDPVVFNTNINNEYAYVFYALQKQGVAVGEALNWIDAVRRNGLEASF